jgi:DNA-binding transcriptional ArsR family regulator
MAYQEMLAALSEPTRRAVFERIIARPLPVGKIAAGLPVTRPAVSQHLRVLREAGLVQERRQGARHLYQADARALGELRAYVDGMWRTALEGFAAAVGGVAEE